MSRAVPIRRKLKKAIDSHVTFFIYFCVKLRKMWQYQILETGFFLADGGAMFGAVPKRAWKRRYPSDENNCCLLAMNTILLRNGNRVVVADTGVGSKHLGKLSYYHFRDLRNITDLLREQGVAPEEVTDVILSHLHFDHCGGCTYTTERGETALTFPQARHHVGKGQWESFLRPNRLERDSFRPEDMLPVEASGLLNLIGQDTELYPGLRLELYDGHTDGQLLLRFRDEEGGAVIAPFDVIPTKAHLSDDWISAYDIRPLESLNGKSRLKESLHGKKVTFVFYHDAYTQKVENYEQKLIRE